MIMRKWRREECLEIGTQVKFVTKAAREWLVYIKADPDEIFTVIANEYAEYNRTINVTLISTSGKTINISNGSSVSEGGMVL